jgi:hypothetical protein
MQVSDQLRAPAALPPGKKARGTHWIGGWVGSRAVLNTVVKRKISSSRRESNPRIPIVYHVALSLYRLSYHCSGTDLYHLRTTEDLNPYYMHHTICDAIFWRWYLIKLTDMSIPPCSSVWVHPKWQPLPFTHLYNTVSTLNTTDTFWSQKL